MKDIDKNADCVPKWICRFCGECTTDKETCSKCGKENPVLFRYTSCSTDKNSTTDNYCEEIDRICKEMDGISQPNQSREESQVINEVADFLKKAGQSVEQSEMNVTPKEIPQDDNVTEKTNPSPTIPKSCSANDSAPPGYNQYNTNPTYMPVTGQNHPNSTNPNTSHNPDNQQEDKNKPTGRRVSWVRVGMVLAIVIALAVGGVVCWKQCHREHEKKDEEPESPMVATTMEEPTAVTTDKTEENIVIAVMEKENAEDDTEEYYSVDRINLDGNDYNPLDDFEENFPTSDLSYSAQEMGDGTYTNSYKVATGIPTIDQPLEWKKFETFSIDGSTILCNQLENFSFGKQSDSAEPYVISVINEYHEKNDYAFVNDSGQITVTINDTIYDCATSDNYEKKEYTILRLQPRYGGENIYFYCSGEDVYRIQYYRKNL